MTLQRIEGMPDLETEGLRTLPKRLADAQRGAGVDDAKLRELMDWDDQDLRSLKMGERRPTPGEMRALYGIFGRRRDGSLKTSWAAGEKPPLKPADWVLLLRGTARAPVAVPAPPVLSTLVGSRPARTSRPRSKAHPVASGLADDVRALMALNQALEKENEKLRGVLARIATLVQREDASPQRRSPRSR